MAARESGGPGGEAEPIPETASAAEHQGAGEDAMAQPNLHRPQLDGLKLDKKVKLDKQSVRSVFGPRWQE